MRKGILPFLAAVALAGANDDFVAGLDALEAGRFAEAARGFERAVEADEENADHHLALAVAEIFSERFDVALRALDRANRLQPGRKEAKLWTAVALAMRGDLFEDTNVYPAANRDPFETALREMSRRYGDPAFRVKRLGETPPDAEAVRAAERARFPELAMGFVGRLKPDRPDVSAALRARGIGSAQRGDHASAYADLRHALAAAPDDVEALFHLARCKLALGSPEGARADLTRCLVARSDWREARLARALAEAALGRPDRAKADLEAAGTPPDAAKEVDRILASLPRAPSLSLEPLVDAAKRGESLLPLAEALVLGVESRRLRADETYEEGLRLRRASGDLAELGAFLYANATTVLTEWVEPRGSPRPLRPTDPAKELAEAESALDRALERDGNSVKALAFKAACLIEKREWEGARGRLERALELAPEDPVVLGLVSRVIDHAAQVNAAAAADLRSVKSWSDYWYIYYRYPTEAERQAAAEYDAEAKRLWRKAREALVKAAEAARGTARGPYWSARVAEWDGNAEAARAGLEEAVKLDPRFLDAWRELAVVRGRLGDAKGAFAAQFEAANLSHTTAGPMLKLAWLELVRTAWKSAGAALDRAATDPADWRVAAYRAVAAEGKGDAEAARGWLLAAAAVNEASARLRGVYLSGSAAPLTPEEAAPALALAHRAALHRLEANPEEARALLSAASDLVERVPLAERYRPLPSAMLPDPSADPSILPEAPDLETLAARVRLRLGDALFRLGEPERARAAFEWVASFEARKPSNLPVGQGVRGPAVLATAHLARCAVKRGDWEMADRFFKGMGRPRGLPASNQRELDEIREEVGKALEEHRNGESGDGGAKAELLARRDQIVKRRDALAARLDAPDASEHEKRNALRVVRQLDGEIALLDAQLQAMGGGR
jgi:tetratricopeptide (TPR) repeat protein